MDAAATLNFTVGDRDTAAAVGSGEYDLVIGDDDGLARVAWARRPAAAAFNASAPRATITTLTPSRASACAQP